MSDDSKPAKKTAEPKRNVWCRVIQRGGVKLPGTTHRLGCSHELGLSQEEADDAVQAGIVKIVGIR